MLPQQGSKEWENMVNFMKADLASGMAYTKLIVATRKRLEEQGRDFDKELKQWNEKKEAHG